MYLLWPETKQKLSELMLTISQKAAAYKRRVDFELRIYVIVRETEREAIAVTKYLMSKVNEEKSTEIKEIALDVKSMGIVRRSTIRNISDNGGIVEDNLCTGIGCTRWGCEAVIIGNLDQILQKK